MLKFDMVSLVEPSDVVMLDENVAGFTSDGGSFSELDGGLFFLMEMIVGDDLGQQRIGDRI